MAPLFDSSFLLLLVPPPLLIIVAAAAVALVLLLHHHHVSWSRRKGHPPGSVGPLPLLGETLRLIHAYKTDCPEPFVDERVLRHGRIFTSHIFGERTVFSADPDFNRLVLAGEGRSFFCSYPSSISNLLGAHSLLLTPVGGDHRHKRMHSLILARFASPAALRDSPFHLRDIDRLIRHNLRTCFGEHTSAFRLLDQAKKITFELTMNQLMSVEPGHWTQTLHHHYLNVIEGFFSVPLPLPSFFPFSSYARAIKARGEVAASLRTILEKRREDRRAAEPIMDKKKIDMVDELLSAEEEGFFSSEEEIIDFLLSLLVAGYETTSTIMTLTVKFLTDTPAALAAIRAEHEEILARKDEAEPLDWNDYKSMTFTQCVINETLRVVNVVGGVFRRSAMDIHFKGYTIPKGSKVFASFRAVHLDPDYYKNARTFNPWRWQEKDAPSLTGGSGGTYTPFGGGPRLCPGYELARVEISVFLHYLITRFSWEAAEEDRLVFFPTTRTLKGYPINVRRRRSL